MRAWECMYIHVFVCTLMHACMHACIHKIQHPPDLIETKKKHNVAVLVFPRANTVCYLHFKVMNMNKT